MEMGQNLWNYHIFWEQPSINQQFSVPRLPGFWHITIDLGCFHPFTLRGATPKYPAGPRPPEEAAARSTLLWLKFIVELQYMVSIWKDGVNIW